MIYQKSFFKSGSKKTKFYIISNKISITHILINIVVNSDNITFLNIIKY